MHTIKNILIIILVATLFIIFKPKIIEWLGLLKKEVAPIGTGVNATYQEFKHRDIYKKEKEILKNMSEMEK